MQGLGTILRASDTNAIADALTPVSVFRIPAGTGTGNWNAVDTQVNIKVTQAVRIVNDDAIVHQLQTGGKPCVSGPAIASGTSWNCVASTTYDAAIDGAIVDALTTGRFFLGVAP